MRTLPDGKGVLDVRDKAVSKLCDVGEAGQAAVGQPHEHTELLHLQLHDLVFSLLLYLEQWLEHTKHAIGKLPDTPSMLHTVLLPSYTENAEVS